MTKGLLTGILLLFAHIVRADTVFVSACYGDWPPFSFPSEEGTHLGLSLEIYDAALREMGVDFRFQHMEWQKCRLSFESGKVDAIVDLLEGDFGKTRHQANPIPWAQTFWVHRDSPIKSFESLRQFSGMTTGYILSYHYPEEFNRNTDIKRRVVSSEKIALKALSEGTIDLYVGDLLSTAWRVKNEGLPLRPLYPVYRLEYLGLAFNDKDSDLRLRFERAIDALRSDGTLEHIYRRYLNDEQIRELNLLD